MVFLAGTPDGFVTATINVGERLSLQSSAADIYRYDDASFESFDKDLRTLVDKAMHAVGATITDWTPSTVKAFGPNRYVVTEYHRTRRDGPRFVRSAQLFSNGRILRITQDVRADSANAYETRFASMLASVRHTR
ncbi:hypothetical protein BH09GEM1_BH09GEM1_46050 [soil metagenome]